MKYKVGDRVKIRADLVVGNVYGAEVFVKDMEHYKGNMATITTICGDTYRINIDTKDNVRHWHWTDEMFEEKYEHHTPKFNVGDKVRLRRDLEVDKQYNELTLSSTMYSYHGHDVMTIESIYDEYTYTCKENEYYWGEDMLEKVDEVDVDVDVDVDSIVDIGYYLEYCGHRVIKNVYYYGYDDDDTYLYCINIEKTVEYKLPADSIDFIIPHED